MSRRKISSGSRDIAVLRFAFSPLVAPSSAIQKCLKSIYEAICGPNLTNKDSFPIVLGTRNPNLRPKKQISQPKGVIYVIFWKKKFRSSASCQKFLPGSAAMRFTFLKSWECLLSTSEETVHYISKGSEREMKTKNIFFYPALKGIFRIDPSI